MNYIEIEIATPCRTGWAAWRQAQADTVLKRYENMSNCHTLRAGEKPKPLEKQFSYKLHAFAESPETVNRITDPAELEKKRRFAQAALYLMKKY